MNVIYRLIINQVYIVEKQFKLLTNYSVDKGYPSHFTK